MRIGAAALLGVVACAGDGRASGGGGSFGLLGCAAETTAAGVATEALNGARATGKAVVHGLDTAGEWTLDQFREAGRALLDSPAAHIVASMPVQVRGSGFVPGDSVVVGIGSTLQTLAVVTADGRGNVAATVDLPPGVQPGKHVLFAAGFAQNGDYRVQWTPTTVQGPGVLGPLVLTGLGLLATAAGALGLRRHHHRHC